MELFSAFLDIVLHLDRHLQWLVENYGVWIYAILFAVIYCETGFVVTPFLPGDSLLFIAGTVAAAGGMYVHGLFALLAAASFLGDNTNYWIGRFVGPRVFSRQQSRLFNPAHLRRTELFYEKYGAKTIMLARFVPIVRTFAPFVAGIGRMRYPVFVSYSFAGSIAWVGSLTYAGYYFGNVSFIRQNLTVAVLVVVLLSILPGIIEFARHRLRRAER